MRWKCACRPSPSHRTCAHTHTHTHTHTHRPHALHFSYLLHFLLSSMAAWALAFVLPCFLWKASQALTVGFATLFVFQIAGPVLVTFMYQGDDGLDYKDDGTLLGLSFVPFIMFYKGIDDLVEATRDGAAGLALADISVNDPDGVWHLSESWVALIYDFFLLCFLGWCVSSTTILACVVGRATSRRTRLPPRTGIWTTPSRATLASPARPCSA